MAKISDLGQRGALDGRRTVAAAVFPPPVVERGRGARRQHRGPVLGHEGTLDVPAVEGEVFIACSSETDIFDILVAKRLLSIICSNTVYEQTTDNRISECNFECQN